MNRRKSRLWSWQVSLGSAGQRICHRFEFCPVCNGEATETDLKTKQNNKKKAGVIWSGHQELYPEASSVDFELEWQESGKRNILVRKVVHLFN